MLRLLLPLLCALGLFIGPASAQIYSWTDAEGHRVYSDQPRDGASPVELKPTNVVPPTPTPRTSERNQNSNNQPVSGGVYQELSITSPAHDSAIRSNEGDLTLTVQTDPPLSGSHLLKLSIDGVLSQTGMPGTGAAVHQLIAHNIDRGSHEIAAVVVDARGTELQRSPSITVHLQRTSLNQPSRGGANQAPRAPAAPRAPNVPRPGSGG
ncbi:MAG: DUF4124 domain-containing protein [Pseudomonas sp.]